MKRLAMALIAATVLVGCSGNGEDAEVESSTTEAANPSLNLRIAANCAFALEVTDDGTSLIVDTAPPDGVRPSALDCVYEALEMPETVIARIGRTRSVDGVQEASWESLQASWTYHSPGGLNLIVEMLGEGES